MPLAQQTEENLAVLQELFRTHATDGKEGLFRCWLSLGHLLQGGIAEDHIGRHALGVRQALPQGLQFEINRFLTLGVDRGQGRPGDSGRALLGLPGGGCGGQWVGAGISVNAVAPVNIVAGLRGL